MFLKNWFSVRIIVEGYIERVGVRHGKYNL